MSAEEARDRLAEVFGDDPLRIYVDRWREDPTVNVQMTPAAATALADDLTAGRAAIEAEKSAQSLPAHVVTFDGAEWYCDDCQTHRDWETCPYNDGMAAVFAALDGAAPEPTRWSSDQADWPAHLRDDAPSLTCSDCRRHTWDLTAAGGICRMTQPDGSSCHGRFS